MGGRSSDGRRPIRKTSQARDGARDRVALTTWPRASDARIGSRIVLEWDLVARAHPNVAPIAVVGFALGRALTDNPVANRRVALWSIRPHRTVRLSFAVDAGSSLRIAVVDDADTALNSRQFQRSLTRAVREARQTEGPLSFAIKLIEHLPVVIGRPALRMGSLLSAGFGISLLGIPGAPFGAALISSVERFKLPASDVPFIPFTRCAFVASVGAVTPSVVVREGQPKVVDVVEIAVTVDHRVCDASQIASLLESFYEACYRRPGETAGTK